MGVRNEWNTYTLGRYSEQPDATKLNATVVQTEKDRVVTQAEKDRVVEQPDASKLKSTVVQTEKDRVVTQAEKDRVVEQSDASKLKSTVTQSEKDRTISDDVTIVQSDYSKLKSSTKITDGTNIATVTSDGYQDVSMHGNHSGDSISFEEDAIEATTGYVLIDLSDIINYPHGNINNIGLDWLIIAGLGDANAVGYYDIGFITRINGTDSDWRSIFHGHFDKKEERFEVSLNFVPQSIECLATRHLSGGGMKFIDDTTFNTGTTVKGTYSDTTTPAVGDLVLKVTRTAGKANLAVAVGYHSH